MQTAKRDRRGFHLIAAISSGIANRSWVISRSYHVIFADVVGCAAVIALSCQCDACFNLRLLHKTVNQFSLRRFDPHAAV